MREDQFDPAEYRIVFRKILDGFDPNSDTFLLTDYTFKALYSYRENLACQQDLHPDTICDVPLIYLFSKLRPTSADTAISIIEDQGKTCSTLFIENHLE